MVGYHILVYVLAIKEQIRVSEVVHLFKRIKQIDRTSMVFWSVRVYMKFLMFNFLGSPCHIFPNSFGLAKVHCMASVKIVLLLIYKLSRIDCI